MARDYNRKNISRNKPSSSRPFLLMILFFIAGYLTALLFDPESLGQWVSRQTASLENKKVAKKKNLPQPQEERPKPKFEFYTLLTNEHQASKALPTPPVVNPAPAKPVSIPQTVEHKESKTVVSTKSESKEHYVIQVASFKSRQDAERLKATLILQGFDVHLKEVIQANSHWYRVLIGPYPDRKKAENAKAVIARTEHVMGIIRKQDT